MYSFIQRPSDVKILYPLYLNLLYGDFRESIFMLSVKESVGVPRIELGLSAPKADVLPIYYTPTHSSTPRRRTTDI